LIRNVVSNVAYTLRIWTTIHVHGAGIATMNSNVWRS